MGRSRRGSRPVETITKSGVDAELYEAFGEKRSIYQWSRDKRCKVSSSTLWKRISLEDMSVEDAITAPPKKRKKKAKRKLVNKGGSLLYEAFGEYKTIYQWSKDQRCVVSEVTIWNRLRINKMPLEEALTREPFDLPFRGRGGVEYRGLGEKKTVVQWAKDERCEVSRTTLWKRLDSGWKVEDALKRERHDVPLYIKRRMKKPPREIWAFGEGKTIAAWARDPRCKVKRTTLHQRLKSGWTNTEAISTPPIPAADCAARRVGQRNRGVQTSCSGYNSPLPEQA